MQTIARDAVFGGQFLLPYDADCVIFLVARALDIG